MALFIPIGAGVVGGGTSAYIYWHIFQSAQQHAARSRVASPDPGQPPNLKSGWGLSLIAGVLTAGVLKVAALDTLVPKQTQPRDIRHFSQFASIVGPRYAKVNCTMHRNWCCFPLLLSWRRRDSLD
jgi:hypothetical protein